MRRLIDSRALSVVLSLVVAPTAVLARLGDSEQALVERFGSAIGSQPEKVIAAGRFVELGKLVRFRQADWSITCSIIEGHSAKEAYHKPGAWSDDQLLAVLNANAQGARWAEVSKPAAASMIREWRRSDGATARWERPSGMTVTHPAYDRAKAVAVAQAEAEAARVPRL